jgi:hypothetical protein
MGHENSPHGTGFFSITVLSLMGDRRIDRLGQTQRPKRDRKAVASQEKRQVAKLRLSQADQHTPHFEGSTLSVAMCVSNEDKGKSWRNQVWVSRRDIFLPSSLHRGGFVYGAAGAPKAVVDIFVGLVFTLVRGAEAGRGKDYAPALCLLGLIDAALGNKQAALEEGRRAMSCCRFQRTQSTDQ